MVINSDPEETKRVQIQAIVSIYFSIYLAVYRKPR